RDGRDQKGECESSLQHGSIPFLSSPGGGLGRVARRGPGSGGASEVGGAASASWSGANELPQPMMTVDPISTAKVSATRRLVRALVPVHSFRAIPQRVLKIMMLAMWSVQLEKPNRPIWLSPMV